MRLNPRVLSGAGFAALLIAGTAATFVPFYQGAQEMKAFCASLQHGTSSVAVRTRARAEGYLVSYELRFTAPDGGAAREEDLEKPLREGGVEDPQFPLLNCLLTFDADGQLTSATYQDN
jgi:hypothetical protein